MESGSTVRKGALAVLKTVLKNVLGAIKTILKVASWLVLVAGLGAAGLVMLGVGPPGRPWNAALFGWWLLLLQPAIIVAAIAAVFPKARYSPVLTTVSAAAIAVLLFCGVMYAGFILHQSH